MGATILHRFQCTVPQANAGGESGIVGPNEWNDSHALFLGTTTITADYALSAVNDLGSVLRVNAAKSVTITLGNPTGQAPASGLAIGFHNGWSCVVTNRSDYSVILAGGPSITLNRGQAVTLVIVDSVWIAIPLAGMSGSAQTVLSGDQAVPEIATDQNDWVLPNIASKTVFILTATADVNVTGIETGFSNPTDPSSAAPGQVIILINDGPKTITLKSYDAASSAANRFWIPADIPLAQRQSVMLWNDPTSHLWRPVGGAGGGGSGGGSAAITQYQFVATAGQTIFTGNDTNGQTLSITPSSLVTRNGAILRPGADYSTTATTLTLPAGASQNDFIGVIRFG